MRTIFTQAAGCLLAGVLASGVQAADVRPAVTGTGPEVHKMVILNGPTYTAHYFSAGLSDSDQATLRDLERAENDADYAQDLQTLRRQYVALELSQSANRAAVQQTLYGQNVTHSFDYQTTGGYGPGYYGGYNGGLGFAPGYLYGGYGYGGGWGGTAFAGYSSSVNQSLANGVGDEGALKTALAPVIAGQANSEFAASAAHAYTTALNRAAGSDGLRTAMGMGRPGVGTPVAAPDHVTLMLKGGEKVEGDLIDEDADWMTVHTLNDRVSVRRSEVTRIDHHLPGK